MDGGWTGDGAVQDQMDDTGMDAVLAARVRMTTGGSELFCVLCGDDIPEGCRAASVLLCASSSRSSWSAILEGANIETENESMTSTLATDWNGATIRTWLESRIGSARADQAAAQRGGRKEQDDCDKASAEEMVCTFLRTKVSIDDRKAFSDELRAQLDREDFTWSGVYDDARFDRHVRSYLRRLITMTKTNKGFTNMARYQ